MQPRLAAAQAHPPPPPCAPPPSRQRRAQCRLSLSAPRLAGGPGLLRAHLQPAREEAVLLCGGCLQLRARVLAAALEAAVGRDRAGGAHVLRRGAALQAPAARREAGRGPRRGGPPCAPSSAPRPRRRRRARRPSRPSRPAGCPRRPGRRRSRWPWARAPPWRGVGPHTAGPQPRP